MTNTKTNKQKTRIRTFTYGIYTINNGYLPNRMLCHKLCSIFYLSFPLYLPLCLSTWISVCNACKLNIGKYIINQAQIFLRFNYIISVLNRRSKHLHLITARVVNIRKARTLHSIIILVVPLMFRCDSKYEYVCQINRWQYIPFSDHKYLPVRPILKLNFYNWD